MRTSELLIAGAGIIGLATAFELALAGAQVTVLEQGEPMREASWAAAGMLAAADPENPSALRPLSELSLALYPDFLARVENLSGVHVPLRTSLTLQGHRRTARSPRTTERVLSIVPDLVHDSYHFTELAEHSLDPRDLGRALPLAAKAAGVTLYPQTAVTSVSAEDGGCRIETSRGEFTAEQYIHCCGAWSALARLPGPSLAVEPRKGQMLAVTMPAGAPELGCVLRTPELYLVPRGGGRVVIGATVEHAGFDRSISLPATDALLEAAAALWPPIRLGTVAERWVGFRPAAPDLLPLLGPLVTGSRTWIATGHYRNGILLAPATARLMVELIQGSAPSLDLRDFDPTRSATVDAAG